MWDARYIQKHQLLERMVVTAVIILIVVCSIMTIAIILLIVEYFIKNKRNVSGCFSLPGVLACDGKGNDKVESGTSDVDFPSPPSTVESIDKKDKANCFVIDDEQRNLDNVIHTRKRPVDDITKFTRHTSFKQSVSRERGKLRIHVVAYINNSPKHTDHHDHKKFQMKLRMSRYAGDLHLLYDTTPVSNVPTKSNFLAKYIPNTTTRVNMKKLQPPPLPTARERVRDVMDDRDVTNNRDVTSTYTIMTPTTETADTPSFPALKPNINCNVRYSRFAGDLHVTDQNNRTFSSSSVTQQSTKECPYLEMRTEIYGKYVL
uniref:uncharacterized protein LOC108950201 isoform X2 n=1 Tax=Ciona intestinalis TaxID=7719 RepID=UPI000EF5539C|nr:uncharacterized protein LOC108950201 isoform X2 [Ciona intestinalis]|eukprot:XP_026693834.1 uncharacterized protein LOC108950201 isoform X2 [Ciona intestinalis]